MKNEKVLLFILAFIQFSHIVDFMIIMPLGAEFMEIFDINPQQLSLIVSSYALAATVSGLLSALFIDRFDRKKALLVLFAGFTIGTLVCSIAPGYYLFLTARSLTGAFGGILSALILSIIGDVIPFERRSTAMGIVMTAFSVASVVGVPFSLFLAAKYTWQAPFVAIGVLSIFVLILIFLYVPSLTIHLKAGKVQRNPFLVIKNIITDSNQRWALLFTTVLMLGHFTIIPFIAPYMELNVGFSKYDIVLLYTIGGLLTAVLLPIIGKLSDKFGNQLIFAIASFFALFSIYAITNLPAVSIPIALCVTSSFFVVASGRNVPATAMVTSVVKPENRGSFMSVRSSFNEFALFLGAIISGLIIDEKETGELIHYEIVGYFTILMAISAVLIAYRLKTVS